MTESWVFLPILSWGKNNHGNGRGGQAGGRGERAGTLLSTLAPCTAPCPSLSDRQQEQSVASLRPEGVETSPSQVPGLYSKVLP